MRPCPAPEPEVIELQREMTISHQDFRRLLPAATPGCRVVEPGDRFEVTQIIGEGRLLIDLGPQRERRLGALRLPVTDVGLRFSGFDRRGYEAFLKRFDLAFQRGGG